MFNFKSYKDERIEFDAGKIVIHGLNGSGKTTILKAILYALLGRVQRLGKLVPKRELVRKGTDSFTVELVFEIDGEEYMVQRTNYIDNKEPIAKLWKGEELISEKQQAVTQEITDLMGIDSATFENVIYIGQGEIPQIATETPSWRKKLFDQFLSLDVYETVFAKFRDAVSRNKNRIENLESRINELKRDTRMLPEAEKNLQNYENKLAKTKIEQVEVEKQFEKIKKEYEVEETKRLELDRLIHLKEERKSQFKDVQSRIAIKRGEIESKLGISISIDRKELKDLLSTHQHKKEEIEKDLKELNEFVKIQEQIGRDLEGIGKRIEDSLKDQEKNQENITDNKNRVGAGLPELKRLDFELWKSSIQSKIELSTNKINQFKSAREATREKRANQIQLETELGKVSKSIKENEDKLKKTIGQLEKINKDWKSALDLYISTDFEKLREIREKQISEMVSVHKDLIEQDAILRNSISEKNEELDKIKALEEGVKCPQCQQTVTGDHKLKIIEAIKSELTSLTAERKELSKKILEKETELTEQKEQIKDLQGKFNEYQKIKPLAEKIDELETQITDGNKEREDIRSKLETLVIDKTEKQYDDEISAENERLQLYNSANARVDNIERFIAANENIKAVIIGLNQQNEKLQKNYNPIKFEESKTNIKQQEENLDKQNSLIPAISNIHEWVIQKDEIEEKLNLVTSDLSKKEKTFDKKQYEMLKNEREGLNRRLGEIKSEIETLSKDLIPNLTLRIKEMREKIEELDEKVEEIEISRKKSVLISMIRDFCRDITPILRKQKTALISSKASEIFLDLVGSSGEFDGIKVTENYDLYVSRYGVDEDITILSGGEQVISCLAIRLAVSEILANQGLILLDEPTSHLDESHVKDLVEVFEIYSPVKQLITVTHDDEFEKIADLLIQAYKERGVSQVM